MRPIRSTSPPVVTVVLTIAAGTIAPAASAQRSNPPVELELHEQFEVPPIDAQSRAIVAAARGFLTELSDDLRQRAVLPFSDNAQRANWSNLPEAMAPRAGVQVGELSDAAEEALFALLEEALGPAGARNVDLQLVAEEALGNQRMFQRDFYRVSFVGEPAEDSPWMLQFGGHHLAINTTVFGPRVSFAPMLTGGQPTTVSYRGEEVYILEDEVTAAHALLASLTPEQRSKAIRSQKTINLLLGPGEDDVVLAPEGLPASELDGSQKDLLMTLIDARLALTNEDDRAAKRSEVLAEIDQIWFGWWGPEEPTGTGYFRVTAPSLVLEYAPQGRDPRDHVHSMYREPGNDYGAQWIAVAPE